MSVAHTYPGVYVEELPSAARTIMGVSTSITAFVGRALKGPTQKAILIHSFGDYVRIFGGLWKNSNMSYAVYQYYQNGGTDAVIVRLHLNGVESHFTSNDTNLSLKAASPGKWGDNLRISITDSPTEKTAIDPDTFNLILKDASGTVLETFLNVSTNPTSPRFIGKILVDGVSEYLRVDGAVPANKPNAGAVYDVVTGSDGDPITAAEFSGDQETTGLYALRGADIFNLLCIPTFNEDDDSTRAAVYSEAIGYCNKRRAMLIVDPQKSWATKENAKANVGFISRDKNAAIFFPRIKAPDPQEDYRLREFDPCGAVAGVIARTDSQRGVWKAPAGIEATLVGVPDLAVQLTNEETGELNPIGINCLRTMSDAGRVVWGSRTMRGADSLADQWKYLPVRRMALYIEETLYRGTQWVVFEPNDEKLWSQIRLNVGAFMHSLFIKGAFQGTDPKKAYLVKCDNETTTQNDIDSGIVNILVGFAPLKPAEFVILKIQQLAGQESE